MKYFAFTVAHNHPEITKRCIQSLSPFFENNILVVHNGSLDKFTKNLINEFPSLHHIVLENNLGYSGGVNIGLKFCIDHNFDVAYFFSNDTILYDFKIVQNIPPGMYGPVSYRRNLNKIDSVGGYFCAPLGKLHHCRSIDEWHRVKPRNQYLPGVAFCIHKEVILKTGYLDESLHSYWEDVDFSMRVKKDFSIDVLPTFQIIHAVGKTGHSNPLFTTYYFNRNRIKVSRRYTHAFVLPVLYIVLTWSLIAVSLKLCRKKNFKNLKLLLQAYRNSF